MIFSSISFLFFFLPLLFLAYFVTPKKYRNYVLLLFSLLFYFLGEKKYTLLLLFSCFVNYAIGLMISKQKSKAFLSFGLLFNIGLLFYFKYTNFFLETFAHLFKLNPPTLSIILPLGISFFTFQNISYLIDVYRKEVSVEHNFLNYATYITLFPQLVAGPIVRYKEIKDELEHRKESFPLFAAGIKQFIIGLAKKVIIADTIYEFYTSLLNTNPTMLTYITIAVCFTFQIYYDFSGYSDMAIGLGKMFGFHFKKNFDYPLWSFSITEFWRKWHISLSTFFKEYVYIPLGGNRCTPIKHIRNILIVWLLTGLWHGASWNFIFWGLYFGLFLLLEKYILKKILKRNIFSYTYTIIIVIVSFVIFSIDDTTELFSFLKGMLGFNVPLYNRELLYYLKNNIGILLIATLCCTPLLKNKITNLKKGKVKKGLENGRIIVYLTLFLISISKIVSSSFNPFIYFRF